MATRPSRIFPPYEVMGTSLRSGKAAFRDTAMTEGTKTEDTADERAVDWQARLRRPVVLRIPRGFAILIGLTALGLVLLSYWVGHHRGYEAAGDAFDADLDAEVRMLRHSAILSGVRGDGENIPMTSDASGASTLKGAHPHAAIRTGSRDPRVEGLNYFVLARDSRPRAEMLLQFLWQHGVDAVAVRYDNDRDRRFGIIALDHGFSKQEILGPQYQDYLNKLDRLGRLWEATYPWAKSFDKLGMYPAKYVGRPADEVLTR